MTLNIDGSAINKKLRIIPDEHQDNVITWLQNDKNKVRRHKKIEPFPGICVKTFSKSGDKVFINLCHSKEIVPPEDVTDEQFWDIMKEDVPSFVIPMAIGTEKMAKDAENIEKSTFDILINTKYYEKCMTNQHFLQFTIAAILESINEKYNKCVDTSNYIILTNKKVMGYLDTFTIEDREPKKPQIKKPLIQVIDVPGEKNNKPKNTETNVNFHPKVDNFVIVKSNNQDHLIGLFYLPSSHLTDITVEVGENRIIIEHQKADIMIDTLLPQFIDNSHVVANFDSKLHILRLTLPLKK